MSGRSRYDADVEAAASAAVVLVVAVAVAAVAAMAEERRKPTANMVCVATAVAATGVKAVKGRALVRCLAIAVRYPASYALTLQEAGPRRSLMDSISRRRSVVMTVP